MLTEAEKKRPFITSEMFRRKTCLQESDPDQLLVLIIGSDDLKQPLMCVYMHHG